VDGVMIFYKMVAICFTQMTAKKGILMYGEREVAEMLREYKQLNDLNVFVPENPENLMHKQKRDAPHAINLIKEKQCGRIKGRTCADGSKQRSYIPKEETSSPAIVLEAFFASLLIYVFEDRSVQMFNIPGAYLHVDLPKDKNM